MSPRSRRARTRSAASVAAAALALLLGGPGVARADSESDAERIYREGILPSGKPLQGVRAGGLPIEGRAAACVNCHRRSGIGVNEGPTVIPPITGKYLLHPGERPLPEAVLQPAGTNVARRERYNDETLARAIREGINADGKSMSPLMPRYALSDAEVALLVAYLTSLSSRPVPGVAHDELSFATIVTPDADPAERAGTLEVLQRFFANKDVHERAHDPPLVSARRIRYRVIYRWKLHVWELSGPPDSWDRQLRAHMKADPVFAVISGVGGGDWTPVHRFCEAERLPCLFPNVRLPVVAEANFYPVYFSRGVLLEADLIRLRLQANASTARRVIQVYRQGDIGEAAARALRLHAGPGASSWIDQPLRVGEDAGAVRAALSDVHPGDTLVLWLRGNDLRELPSEPPTTAIFASGLMAGLEEAPLPPAWRSVTRITYPVDLPERRAMRLIQPLTWFHTQGIPVVAERVQVDTYVACQLLSEAVAHAFADLVPDYLIEQLENMASVKLLDGYYPRLGLAPGQRFASKGGYIVRLAPDGAVTADVDWTVP